MVKSEVRKSWVETWGRKFWDLKIQVLYIGTFETCFFHLNASTPDYCIPGGLKVQSTHQFMVEKPKVELPTLPRDISTLGF